MIKNVIIRIFSCTLICLSIGAYTPIFAQSKETKEALNAYHEDADEPAEACDSSSSCCSKTLWLQFNLQGGMNSFQTKINSNTYNIYGGQWAASGYIGYPFACCAHHKMMVGTGLEVSNLNNQYTYKNATSGNSYDNVHYWYAGIPVFVQVTSDPISCCKKWGYYGTVGATFNLKLAVQNTYSAQGNEYNINIGDRYTTGMIQPFVRAGASYKLSCATLLVGPYVSYTANNIMKTSGNTERALGYGISIATLFN